jgi:predicted TIM-barrel fold metal-dependent hydrolase
MSETLTHLHYVYDYTERDRAFWEEHLEGFIPKRLIDAHVHATQPALRRSARTEAERREFWTNEVFEPQDADTAARCAETIYPNREVTLVAFGMPDLAYDTDAANAYTSRQCAERGWYGLAVSNPAWTVHEVERALNMPRIVGFKPYFTMMEGRDVPRDEQMEVNILEFLPHAHLEVLNDRGGWVTLHVPRRDRLGHPENIREIQEIRKAYPNVIIVLAHLGRCYTEPHAREGLLPLADDPGLYFDNSAVLNPATHRIAFEHIGPERIVYGTDNPIFYMRGRRQWHGREYTNRTSYPFHFNKEREAPEIEARYTLYIYEALKAIKDVSEEMGLTREQIEGLFHDNARRLLEGALKRKAELQRDETA